MNTTIAISVDVKEKIREFGMKGETYNDIITRIYDAAKQQQLQTLLMDTKNTVSIDDAIARAKRRWRKS